MYGFVYGAEKSWNVMQKADGIFDKKINHLLYGSPHGAAAIKELSQFVTDIDWRDFVKMYSDMIYPEQLHPHIPTLDEIERIQCAYLDFKEQYENETWEKDQYRQEMLIQAEGIAVIAELMGAAQGYPVRRFTDTREWLKKFEASWRERNKESELGEIVKMFEYLEKRSIQEKR